MKLKATLVAKMDLTLTALKRDTKEAILSANDWLAGPIRKSKINWTFRWTEDLILISKFSHSWIDVVINDFLRIPIIEK